jgi:hypothetical protein
MSDGLRHIRCLIEGSNESFKVSVDINGDVDDLKKCIYDARIGLAFRNIDWPNLKLLKVPFPSQSPAL